MTKHERPGNEPGPEYSTVPCDRCGNYDCQRAYALQDTGSSSNTGYVVSCEYEIMQQCWDENY